MDIKDCIFTSYCFTNEASGGDYYAQQVRLKESILKIYPEANLHFSHEPEKIGKPKFQQSLYGFKVRLVHECLEMGYKKICFFDAAVTVVDKIDYWFDLIKDYGVLAIGGKQDLSTVTSDNLKKYLGLTEEHLESIKLVGGSIYVFDFDLPECQEIFNYWADLEEKGYFGTQDDLSNDRLQGHRCDETCMSVALVEKGIGHVSFEQMRYGYIHPTTGGLTKVGDYEPVIIKRHFK